MQTTPDFKVLFVGMGSIGRRHFESCCRVRPQYRYAAWRSGKGAPSEGHSESLLQFHSWPEVETFHPDLVFVCNPTAYHSEVVRKLLPLKTAFFIEKPLAHRKDDVEIIAQGIRVAGLPFFYGCLLRFHPLIVRVRELVQQGSLGKPLSYRITAGSYLPDWRPNRNYRTTYSARRDLGGGVSLDLIHEFDYAEHWFGPIQEMVGFKGKMSQLEIETDDFCSASVVHLSGTVGQVSLNYFHPQSQREFEVVFAAGCLKGDLLDGRLEWHRRKQDGSLSQFEESHPAGRDELHDLCVLSVFETLEKKLESRWNVTDAASLVKKVLGLRDIGDGKIG